MLGQGLKHIPVFGAKILPTKHFKAEKHYLAWINSSKPYHQHLKAE
jgi:hypothetical protein